MEEEKGTLLEITTFLIISDREDPYVPNLNNPGASACKSRPQGNTDSWREDG